MIDDEPYFTTTLWDDVSINGRCSKKRFEKIIVKKVEKLEADKAKLVECVKSALSQRGQMYGMENAEAIYFRERRVFGLLSECLKDLGIGEGE